jgi:hypothetical protein
MVASRVLRLSVFALMLVMAMAVLPNVAVAGGGNSAAAHACQKGGYLSLVGAGGETFNNTGECVSFAAQGGTFATGIVIPAGSTAMLSNAIISACNEITYGYEVNLGADVAVDTKPMGCATVAADGATVGPFSTAVLLRIFLTDVVVVPNDDCTGGTYYSDGNHARVVQVDADTFEVDLTDSGFFCEGTGPRPVPSNGDGNVSVQVDIN